MEKTLSPSASRALQTWLGVVCALVVMIVAVGGITRLTRSGLSIVEWKPISGIIPPLSEAAWEVEFDKYKQYPEYKLLNHGMTLGEFKFIFFWEYFHRLLGRLIGLAFLIPGLVFWRKGWIDRKLGLRLMLCFFLGGVQGALGWYMVKSGLVENPHVSHFRLAAHLSLAFAVSAYLLWLMLDLGGEKAPPLAKNLEDGALRIRRALKFVTSVLIIQIFYGAFTAGLRAGFGFNTFPKMNEEWIPTGLFRAEFVPAWINLLENPIAVQFIHRWVGALLLVGVLALGWMAGGLKLDKVRARAVQYLVGGTLVQFGLGVATLVMVVPVSLGTLHQVGACLLLLLTVRALHAFRVG